MFWSQNYDIPSHTATTTEYRIAIAGGQFENIQPGQLQQGSTKFACGPDRTSDQSWGRLLGDVNLVGVFAKRRLEQCKSWGESRRRAHVVNERPDNEGWEARRSASPDRDRLTTSIYLCLAFLSARLIDRTDMLPYHQSLLSYSL